VGNVSNTAWATAPAVIALIWALWEVWHDLFKRRHPPYVALQRAVAAFEYGDAQAALAMFKRAAHVAARHGDLAAMGAAWHGIARAREALGDAPGAAAATAAAKDTERQLG
jgi:hypothetical protein